MKLGLSKKERWDLCRKVIEHEDNLVNHRLTWYLAINGFLMAACGVCLGTLGNADPSRFQWGVLAFLLVNCVLGFVISLLATPAILAAYRHVGVLNSWWALSEDRARDYGLMDYPPLTGEVIWQSPFGPMHPEKNPYSFSDRFWRFHLGDRSHWLLDVSDILGADALAKRIKTRADALSAFIHVQLSGETLAHLTDWDFDQELPRAALKSLVKDLNNCIALSCLWNEARFSGVKLRPETEELRDADPEGESLWILNRRLLEDAYPGIVSRDWRISRDSQLLGPERYPALFALFWGLCLLALTSWGLALKESFPKTAQPKAVTVRTEIGGYELEVTSPNSDVADTAVRLIRSGGFLKALPNPSSNVSTHHLATNTPGRFPADLTKGQ